MDALQKAWQELQKKQFSDQSIETETILDSIHHESQAPMQILKKRCTFKLYWMIAFTVVNTMALLLSWQNRDLVLVFGIFEIYFLSNAVYVVIQVKKINALSLSDDLKHVITEYSHRVKRILHFEETLGLIFLPIAVVGGGIIGAITKRGATIQSILEEPRLLLILLGIVIIYTPLGYLGSKWINQRMYGGYLKQLDEYQRQMD